MTQPTARWNKYFLADSVFMCQKCCPWYPFSPQLLYIISFWSEQQRAKCFTDMTKNTEACEEVPLYETEQRTN